LRTKLVSHTLHWIILSLVALEVEIVDGSVGGESVNWRWLFLNAEPLVLSRGGVYNGRSLTSFGFCRGNDIDNGESGVR
jgi:hypothetical protein